ncbi:hypothetical protein MSG28_003162 [Choristoneura fumiferana]|uniref:Uncharacterized protein n=1 Tax=Choristoneura fumiferana TaxID=7141 RepID=A0ACC0KDS0_CHOFU|nr:hypothetical protein MSG28_003162 [Choristoneura fumiferana]
MVLVQVCSDAMMEDLSFVPDLPSGPLDTYRNAASFDWKRLKLALEGDIENLKLKRLQVTPRFFVRCSNHLVRYMVVNNDQ